MDGPETDLDGLGRTGDGLGTDWGRTGDGLGTGWGRTGDGLGTGGSG